jgi:hypothetical protein
MHHQNKAKKPVLYLKMKYEQFSPLEGTVISMYT